MSGNPQQTLIRRETEQNALKPCPLFLGPVQPSQNVVFAPGTAWRLRPIDRKKKTKNRGWQTDHCYPYGHPKSDKMDKHVWRESETVGLCKHVQNCCLKTMNPIPRLLKCEGNCAPIPNFFSLERFSIPFQFWEYHCQSKQYP